MITRKGKRSCKQSGFTLLELLVVVAILSILSVIMVMTVDSSRRAGIAAQAESSAQQKARLTSTLLERDIRVIGEGLFSIIFRNQNGGDVGELVGDQDPGQFDYEIDPTDLEGFMVPPIEIINGTDNDPDSYLNPLHLTIGLSTNYRAPNSDVVTVYSMPDTAFSGRIDEYEGLGQENFGVTDMVLGQRLFDIFNQMGGNPILVMVIDDDGQYATFRCITNISRQAGEYSIKMEPSQSVNQPASFKAFLESLGHRFTGPGGPEMLRQMVDNDFFGQVAAVSYFIYYHPDIADSGGWLVRLDLPAIVAGSLDIDATDPDTMRPFVIAENVVDFQVALGIDSDENGLLDPGEWHNSEDMETYSHSSTGEGSVSDEFVDMVNNLKEVRLTVIARTDNSAADDPYGFMKRDAAGFGTRYSSVGEVAEMIGIAPQIEDHNWGREELLDRLWYHRAVQLSRCIKIRNLDLANTFARTQ